MIKNLYVVNSRGEKEPFSFKKVYQSAKRVGASESLARKTTESVAKTVYPGIKTSEIFNEVKNLLQKENSRAAIKFSLKKAIQKLGPTGFPFEKYVGAIFESLGFKVKLNQFLWGRCLKYEIDFLAKKENLLYVGECKYRSLLEEGKVHSNIVLILFGKFFDLKEGIFSKDYNLPATSKVSAEDRRVMEGLESYLRGPLFKNLNIKPLLGWRYPKNKGLEYLIESQNLYPITILPSLKNYLAEILVSKKIMLVKDFLKLNVFKFSKENNIPLNYLEALVKEGKILLGEKLDL
jgi:hypothetical protein